MFFLLLVERSNVQKRDEHERHVSVTYLWSIGSIGGNSMKKKDELCKEKELRNEWWWCEWWWCERKGGRWETVGSWSRLELLRIRTRHGLSLSSAIERKSNGGWDKKGIQLLKKMNGRVWHKEKKYKGKTKEEVSTRNRTEQNNWTLWGRKLFHLSSFFSSRQSVRTFQYFLLPVWSSHLFFVDCTRYHSSALCKMNFKANDSVNLKSLKES